ncbi:MAG: molybdopterin molybdenumtransferase MoeA, partial [Bacteroidota bacterium]
MISIEEAQQIIKDQQFALRTEMKALHELRTGYILAEEIRAPVDLPLFNNSMMDGYVVSSLTNRYEVIGQIRAGDTASYHLPAGKAYRIFTGAKTPENSLAVIMQEKATTA